MEKRPSGIYLIITMWLAISFLKTFSQQLRIIKENEVFGELTLAIVTIIGLALVFFAIWEIKGLIYLKKGRRWIAIGYFIMWTLTAGINLLSLAIEDALTTSKLRVYLFVLIANGLSIYYLIRPKFIISPEQFNKEIDAMKLQKSISDKHQAPGTKMQKNIKWILAIAISLLVIIIYQYFFLKQP